MVFNQKAQTSLTNPRDISRQIYERWGFHMQSAVSYTR